MPKAGNRVAGFTLLEMVVAICIGAAIAGLVLFAITMVKEQWGRYAVTQQNTIDLLMFKYAMDRDLERAQYVFTNDGSRYDFAYAGDTIYYFFDKHVMRVQGTRSDTFKILLKDGVQAEFVQPGDGADNVVQAIHLHIVEPVDIPQVTFKKYYDSYSLLKLVEEDAALQ